MKKDMEAADHVVDTLLYPGSAFSESESFGETFISHVRAQQYDLIMVIKGEIISGDTIQAVRKSTSAKVVLWVIDDPFLMWFDNKAPQLREISVNSYAYYDAVFVFDTFYVERLHDIGIHNAAYLPFCFSPSVFYPFANQESVYDISFIGYAFKKRAKILLELLDYNLHLIGPGWVNEHIQNRVAGTRVTSEEANRLYNQSKINLNIHHFQSVRGSNTRTFEVLGAGGFLLVEPLDDLKAMFDDGKDLVFYHGIDDLKNKIDYYLVHDDERMQIAQSGYEKVCQEHTFKNRLGTLMAYVSKTVEVV